MRADNEEEMGAEKRPTLDRKRLTDPEVPRSPSRERLRLLAPEGGNMQHLTLPSSMTYSAGGRLGSIVSHKSEDALSSVSVGSILRSTGEVDDYFWEASSSLVLSQLEKLPLKDFSSEIRANMDIKLFIKEATLLLNLEASTLEDIIHEMLTAVFSNTTGASGGLNGDVIEHNSSLAVGGHSTSNFRVTPVSSPTAADSATLPHGISTSELNSPTSEALPVDTLIEKAKKALFLQITLNEHSYYRLCKTIKAVSVHDDDQMLTDQSWICALCSLKEVHKRYVAMARLAYPVNLGRSSEGTQIILLVISPLREKKTKCDTELGRTFATILSDLEFRRQLIYAADENEVKSLLWARAHELQIEQEDAKRQALKVCELPDDLFQPNPGFHLFRGVISDLRRKIPFYPSDFLDAYRGAQTIRKVISAIFFLYFFCLLPSLAFGVLNAKNTMGKIGVYRVLLSQVVGGLCYGVIGGQPLIILLSTAPLALYIKLIFCVTQTYQIDFYAFFGCVGLFNAGFLFIYAAVDASKVMRWSTRSTEEIFAFFVSIAFLVEAYRDLVKEFETYYSCQSAVTNGSEQQRSKQAMLNTAFSPTNSSNYLADDTEGGTPARQLKRALTRVLRSSLRNETPFNISLGNLTTASPEYPACKPEVSMLYLLLMFCTLWMFISMLNFTKTPFLTERKRELLRDVALPSTVLVMSFIGSYVFRHIDLKPFEVDSVPFEWEVVSLHRLDWIAALGALVLAFPLSLLFFMEQNIASAIVNSPSNKLKKGTSYHWDLLVVGLINAFLSMFGLPWIHGALPHSPMHVRALADMEERIDIGHHVQQTVIRVRETRVTSIVSHIGIGLSIFLLPRPLTYIPRPVLNGLFIYMAITSIRDNQLWERFQLLFIEQSAYPPSHYLRRVPQRRIHLFTALQLLQLGILCGCGFAEIPFVKIGFPILLFLQLLVRHKLIPCIIDKKYLEAMDRPI